MNKEIYGYVYMIRNKVNGKIYFGITVNDFKRRYYGDIVKNTHSEHLKNSFEKYGIENFEINEQFDIAYSEDDLWDLEDMYICLYDTIKNGYNVRRSGSKHKGRGSYDMSVETINKMSNSAKRKVVCLNNEETFNSMLDAVEWADGRIDKTGTGEISLCCTGDRKRAYKHPLTGESLAWAYLDDYIKMTPEEINLKIYEATKEDDICMDMDNFSSVQEFNMNKTPLEERMANIYKFLSPCQKYVFEEHILRGEIMEVVAERHNVSKARINNLTRQIIKKITERYTYEEFINLLK